MASADGDAANRPVSSLDLVFLAALLFLGHGFLGCYLASAGRRGMPGGMAARENTQIAQRFRGPAQLPICKKLFAAMPLRTLRIEILIAPRVGIIEQCKVDELSVLRDRVGDVARPGVPRAASSPGLS